jgi:hypothetical protein
VQLARFKLHVSKIKVLNEAFLIIIINKVIICLLKLRINSIPLQKICLRFKLRIPLDHSSSLYSN